MDLSAFGVLANLFEKANLIIVILFLLIGGIHRYFIRGFTVSHAPWAQ